jgi:hypothetical protein
MSRVLRVSGLEAVLGSHQIFLETPVLISSTLEAVRRAYELLGTDFCATCPRRQEPASGGEPWHYMI